MAIEWLFSNTTIQNADYTWRGSQFQCTSNKVISRIWFRGSCSPLELWNISRLGGTIGTKIGGGNPKLSSVNNARYFDLPITTLVANQCYMIVGLSSNYYSSDSGTPNTITGISASGGFNYASSSSPAPSSGMSLVANGNSSEIDIGLELVNSLPKEPTLITASPPVVANGAIPVISWTYNDLEGSPQSQYQIRWRRKE